MARAAQLDVEFTTSGIDTVNRAADGVNLKLGAIGAGLMLTGQQLTDKLSRPILDFLQNSYMGAASLEQAVGKVEAVYGDAADSILAWSRESADAFGMSQTAALDMVGTYGQIMQAQGMAVAQSDEYSRALIGLASDMSAFTDRDISQTSNAIRSALTGEYQSLQQMGIVLKAVEVDQEALNIARAEGTSEITEAHRVQARYNLIMKQTTQMHGQFAREADGASGSLARVKAQWQDITAQVGNVLLPIGSRLTNMLSVWLQGFMKLPQPVITVGVVVAALVAAIGPLLSIVGMMAVGLAALPAAFAAVAAGATAFMAVLVPLLPVIVAVTAAIGLMLAAYRTNFLGFGDVVDSAISRLQRFFALPDAKNFGITTTFDGGLHYLEEIRLPDGTKEWIIKEKDGTEFGKVISSYTDPDDERYAYITIQPTDGGEPFQTRVNLLTSDLDSVELEVTLDTGPAISEWEALKWTFERDGFWGTMSSAFQAMLQGMSDSFARWLNAQGEKWETRLGDAVNWLGDRWSELTDGVGIAWSTTVDEVSKLWSSWMDAITNTTAFETVTGWIDDIGSGLEVVEGIWNRIFGNDDSNMPETSERGNGVTATQRLPRGEMDNSGPGAGSILGSLGRGVGAGFGRAIRDAAESSGLFERALISLDRAAIQSTVSLNAQASTFPIVERGAGTADRSVSGMASGMGKSFSQAAASALSSFTQMRTSATSQASAMESSTTSSASTMATRVGSHVLGMRTAAALQMALMASGATTAGSNMNNGLTSWMAGAITRIVAAMASIVSAVRAVGSTGYDTGYYAGSMISQGFAAGMLSMLGVIRGAANQMVAAAAQAVIAKALISSPSRLFAQYGEYIGEGLELGMRRTIPGIGRTADQMIGATLPLPGLAGGYGGGQAVQRPIVHNHHNHNYYVTPPQMLKLIENAAKGAAAYAQNNDPYGFAFGGDL